jgi:hypothetical protein
MGGSTADLVSPATESFWKPYITAWLANTCGVPNAQTLLHGLVHTWAASGFELVKIPNRVRQDIKEAVFNL